MAERSIDRASHVGGEDAWSGLPRFADAKSPLPNLIVCFSHLRWEFVWQRPQHLMNRAAARHTVIFVEEPVFRPGVTAHLEFSTKSGGVTVAVPTLPDGLAALAIDAVQRDLVVAMIESEPASRRIFWYYTPMAMAFTADLPADLCIYDNMDELSAFRGASPEMLANEAALFARADLVFTGGRSLYEAKRGRHPSVHCLPSSIDVAHFSAARGPDAPQAADQAAIPRPRLGFVGVVDERMDVELVRHLADARPDWQIVMVGPVVKIDPATLPRSPNIHWMGPRNYAELPAYLAGWDAALMPFALNEATRFISPTKTPEYLAAGLPVVSTRIADVVEPYGRHGLVHIADGAEDFVGKVALALAPPASDRLARVDAFLGRGSWDTTWGAMHDLLSEAFEHASSATARPDALAASPAE